MDSNLSEYAKFGEENAKEAKLVYQPLNYPFLGPFGPTVWLRADHFTTEGGRGWGVGMGDLKKVYPCIII